MQRKLLRDSIIKVAKEQVACDLAGEAVILSLKSGQYFGLNEVGAQDLESYSGAKDGRRGT